MIKYQAKVPFKLTKLFIDALGEKPIGKNVMVIRDVFTAMYLAIDNSVTFVTDDIEARRVFERNVLANGEFGNDDKVVYIDIADIDMKTAWLTGIETVTKNMNFDVAIMNPPYERDLHLKVLEKVLKFCDKVVNISPIRWLTDPLAKYKKTSSFNKYKTTICDKLTDVEILDSKYVNDMFATAFNMNIAIYAFDVNSVHYDYNKLNTNVLLDKIIANSADNIANHAKSTVMCNWTIVLSLMIGGNDGRLGQQKYWNDDYDRTVYYNNIRKDGKTYKEYRLSVCWGNVKPREEAYHIEFASEEEVKNFYNYIHTKVFSYVFMTTQHDINPHPDFYPYMSDYTQLWTDKRLCEFFDITGYISDTEAEPGSEWETIIKALAVD